MAKKDKKTAAAVEEKSNEISSSSERFAPDEDVAVSSKPVKKKSKPRRNGAKNSSKARKVVIIILVVLIVSVILVAGFVALKINNYLNLINYDTKREFVPQLATVETFSDKKSKEILEYEEYLKSISESVKELPSDQDVTNILLVGTDNRSQGESGRSDSMMVISINTRTEKVVMTSIMRDLYVAIPGFDHNRINAAYVFGGPSLLIQTIEQTLHIPIDRYVQVDFFSFMKVIDIVGGVDLNVYAGEIEVMQMYIRQLNRLLGRDEETDMLTEADAGFIHLNGIQALAYSRNRYSGNADFERTNRQRKVLDQVFEKAKKLSILQLDQLAQSLLPNLTTDMERSEILSLLVHAKDYLGYDRVSMRIPADGTWKNMEIDGMAVLGMDINDNYQMWKQNVYD